LGAAHRPESDWGGGAFAGGCTPWIGGAKINPDLFLGFQRGWTNNQVVATGYLREQMDLDAGPARGPQTPPISCLTISFE
jgi:hypothetical protein